MTGGQIQIMHFLSILHIIFSSSVLLLCQAADLVPVKSLEKLVLEKYPWMIIYKQDASDVEYAFALGSYLFHHKSQLCVTQGTSNILIDVAKLEKVIFEELLDASVNSSTSSFRLQAKLGAFVKRTMETLVLKIYLGQVQDSSGGLKLIKLSELHKMFARCALHPVAVASIDIAILKWVVPYVWDESFKRYIFSNTMTPSIVDSFLCNAIISFLFLPEVSLFVEEELNDFMACFKEMPKNALNVYGYGFARLMLPLPEGPQKQKLNRLISKCDILEDAKDKADVHLPDKLITLMDVTVDKVKNLREKFNMRTLLGASFGDLKPGTKPNSFTLTKSESCYFGVLVNGQYEKKGLEDMDVKNITAFSIETTSTSDVCNVFVFSLIHLPRHVLDLLARYARNAALSDGDLQNLIYAQAAFGISMITAPKILYF